MAEKSNYHYTIIEQDSLPPQPNGDVETGYQYPRQNRRNCRKWKRFFAFGAITYLMVTLFYHFAGHHCAHVINKSMKWKEYGKQWIPQGKLNKNIHGFSLDNINLFNVHNVLSNSDKCQADIDVEDLPVYDFDPLSRTNIHVGVEGAIYADVQVLPSEDKKARFEVHAKASDEDLASKIKLHKVEVDEGQVNFFLKGPKVHLGHQCATAKVTLYIPSSVTELSHLSTGFAVGKFKLDEKLAKNIHFGNFHIGTVKGKLKLPKITSNTVVIDSVIGDIDTKLVVSESVSLRSVKGKIEADIVLEHGDQESITFDSVLGNVEATISENFTGRFSAHSIGGNVDIKDDGQDGHLHFDKDYKHVKTGLHYQGHSFDKTKARLSVNTVRGNSNIVFV
ncbi:hypothetical protein H4219_000269 [Mycoemilia scoparia]|uniref:DUF4097 domain-containing protein n=1 Tax=Mycoemilia scoparia TaxID=417184 RepID=A0A9W8DRN9_9FUNG|nr:hypothetical protein H4219_000269 [Mycoemilia scoparia]